MNLNFIFLTSVPFPFQTQRRQDRHLAERHSGGEVRGPDGREDQGEAGIAGRDYNRLRISPGYYDENHRCTEIHLHCLENNARFFPRTGCFEF